MLTIDSAIEVIRHHGEPRVARRSDQDRRGSPAHARRRHDQHDLVAAPGPRTCRQISSVGFGGWSTSHGPSHARVVPCAHPVIVTG